MFWVKKYGSGKKVTHLNLGTQLTTIAVKPRRTSINKLKEFAMQAMKQSGVDYSCLVWKPHPQPSDCLCFYHTVKIIAKGKGKSKRHSESAKANLSQMEKAKAKNLQTGNWPPRSGGVLTL